jgi:hypothetical protein
VPAQLKHWPPLLVPLQPVHSPEPPHTSHFTLCSVMMPPVSHIQKPRTDEKATLVEASVPVFIAGRLRRISIAPKRHRYMLPGA